MVSYQQLDQHGIKQIVLHERETTSSGRTKPIRVTEDANSFYTYSRTGKLENKVQKTDIDKYYDFLSREVIYKNETSRSGGQTGTAHQVARNTADRYTRLTPASEYEKSMGYGAINLFSIYPNTGSKFLPMVKQKLKVATDELARTHFLKLAQAEQERLAKEQAELARLTKLREATPKEKPKKKTVFVAPPKPVEVEPIKEVAKYSPLMIAGVIAVIVVLFLRRRA